MRTTKVKDKVYKGNVTIEGDCHVKGDLTVYGTTTWIDCKAIPEYLDKDLSFMDRVRYLISPWSFRNKSL